MNSKAIFTWVAYTLNEGRAKVQFRGTEAACRQLISQRSDLYLKHRPL
jgi:hypothetical protein